MSFAWFWGGGGGEEDNGSDPMTQILDERVLDVWIFAATLPVIFYVSRIF